MAPGQFWKQITKTSGDYSSLKYKPFDAMADKGTIAYSFSSTKGEDKIALAARPKLDKVLIDNDVSMLGMLVLLNPQMVTLKATF